MFSAGRGLIDGQEIVGQHAFMRLSLLLDTGMALCKRKNGVGLEGVLAWNVLLSVRYAENLRPPASGGYWPNRVA